MSIGGEREGGETCAVSRGRRSRSACVSPGPTSSALKPGQAELQRDFPQRRAELAERALGAACCGPRGRRAHYHPVAKSAPLRPSAVWHHLADRGQAGLGGGAQRARCLCNALLRCYALRLARASRPDGGGGHRQDPARLTVTTAVTAVTFRHGSVLAAGLAESRCQWSEVMALLAPYCTLEHDSKFAEPWGCAVPLHRQGRFGVRGAVNEP